MTKKPVVSPPTMSLTQKVDINEMQSVLKQLIDSAPNFDAKLMEYVDNATINRDGFDFYSKEYWTRKLKVQDSICAFATDVYNTYNRFRRIEGRDWAKHWSEYFEKNPHLKDN